MTTAVAAIMKVGRGLEEGWGRIGKLAEGWRVGGGFEKGWGSIVGGFEDD